MKSTRLAELASDTTDPREGLRAVVSLRLLVESLEFQQVEAALRAGLGWGQIAELLGVTRQAVHKKYSNRVDPSIEVPRRNRK
jgi:stalled ribosome rescue protein Dom34